MQKLKLEIDSLRVDSFTTVSTGIRPDGTVHGLESYDTYWCTAPTSVGPNVCHDTDALGCKKPRQI
jgi:hypothetical protein